MAFLKMISSPPADMGRVMKLAMPRIEGRADGKLVGDRVRSLLGG